MARDMRKRIEDLVKGRIAEAIVEILFKASGMRVYYLGFEWKQQHLFQRANGGDANAVLDRLYDMPDFVVENNSGKHELVEVKFRQQGRFVFEKADKDDISREKKMIKKLKEGWAPTIILVSYNTTTKFYRPPFQVLVPPYEIARDGNPINPISVREYSQWKITEEAESNCIEQIKVIFGTSDYNWERKK